MVAQTRGAHARLLPRRGPSWTAPMDLSPRPVRGRQADARLVRPWGIRKTGFAELVAATNYTILRGASHPSDMVCEAIRRKMRGIGIADRNTVAGVVRAHVALKQAREGWNEASAKARARHEADHPWEEFPEPAQLPHPDLDFRLVVGAHLVFREGTPDIVANPAKRYGRGPLPRL